MPPELRKRKAPTETTGVARLAIKKTKTTAPKTVAPDDAPPSPPANSAVSAIPPKVDDTIALDGFGGQVETQDGQAKTLSEMLDEAEKGVVLFTYPKASTPSCTIQARLFRDRHSELTSTGFAIYGLSKDSLKSNFNFKKKQNLPYTLLCDPSASLISAIGLKKSPSSTQRGVFIIDKSGKVLAAEAGGPAATVDVVQKLVDQSEKKLSIAQLADPIATANACQDLEGQEESKNSLPTNPNGKSDVVSDLTNESSTKITPTSTSMTEVPALDVPAIDASTADEIEQSS